MDKQILNALKEMRKIEFKKTQERIIYLENENRELKKKITDLKRLVPQEHRRVSR